MYSYVSDPNGYYSPVGQSWGYDSVEVDFTYTPTMNGSYTAWGYNYYDLEGWWPYDGASSSDVYVSGAGQQMSCPSPSWVLGGNYVQIFGSGFSQTSPTLSWSGNDGVDFLNGDSWVQVYSDVEIMVYADLSPLSVQGMLAVSAGTAACQMPVAPMQAAPPPTTGVQLLVNGTADTSDDITSLAPAQTIPIQVTLTGTIGTVTLSVSPAGRASLDRTSLNLTNGQPTTVTLTPLAVSQAPNDVQITAWYQGAQAAQGSLTIVNVVIPTVTDYAATSDGSPYHVPPGLSIQVPVTIAPDLTGSGQSVTLTALGTGGNFGNFTIDGGASMVLARSATVNVTGTTQTAPSAAPGGAYAGNLAISAQVRGQPTAQSNGFTVAALPAGVSAALIGAAPGYPGTVGILVSLAVVSDSGSASDLDQVQFAENLAQGEQTGSFFGLPLSGASGYVAAVPPPGNEAQDNHSVNLANISRVQGDNTVYQGFMFKDLRTGAANVPFQGSGFSIYDLMNCSPFVGCSTFVTSQTGAYVVIGVPMSAGTTPGGPISLPQAIQ